MHSFAEPVEAALGLPTGALELDGATLGALDAGLDEVGDTLADLWATRISPEGHPFTHLRPLLTRAGIRSVADLFAGEPDRRVHVAGLVTHRQRPPTAGGIVFMTLEDETGIINVVCPPQVFQRHRGLAVDSQALLVGGRLERADGVTNVRATRLRRLPVPGRVRARNFH